MNFFFSLFSSFTRLFSFHNLFLSGFHILYAHFSHATFFYNFISFIINNYFFSISTLFFLLFFSLLLLLFPVFSLPPSLPPSRPACLLPPIFLFLTLSISPPLFSTFNKFTFDHSLLIKNIVLMKNSFASFRKKRIYLNRFFSFLSIS